ncbi:unnamed protein product [Caenorhabditis angaria]|uniref:Uncharacterized protein n=1 Tax=Caenorhabditis angaria TaxID=860376 RepID=A0A9P1IC49_9PELO|nr:unnamed protein product [Caenorhabditis angaria]
MLNIKRNPMLYTLSKKYQLEENLKVMWYLLRLGYLIFGFICLFMILILFPWKLFDLNFADIFFYLDTCLTSGSLIFPSIMLYILYKFENSVFLRKIRWLFRIRVPLADSARTIKISPNVQNETNVYFDQLKNSWK